MRVLFVSIVIVLAALSCIRADDSVLLQKCADSNLQQLRDLCFTVTHQDCMKLSMAVTYKNTPLFAPKTTSLVKALSYVDFGAGQPKFPIQECIPFEVPFAKRASVECNACLKISNYSAPSHQISVCGIATVECYRTEVSHYDFGCVTLDNCFLNCDADCSRHGECSLAGLCHCRNNYHGVGCEWTSENNCITDPNGINHCIASKKGENCNSLRVETLDNRELAFTIEQLKNHDKIELGCKTDPGNTKCQSCFVLQNFTVSSDNLIVNNLLAMRYECSGFEVQTYHMNLFNLLDLTNDQVCNLPVDPPHDIVVVTPTKGSDHEPGDDGNNSDLKPFKYVLIGASAIVGLALLGYVGFWAYKKYQAKTSGISTYVFTKGIVPDPNDDELLDEILNEDD